MGEYKAWLASKTRDLPISELVVGILPETPAEGTPEHKAYLEAVRASARGPARQAILRARLV